MTNVAAPTPAPTISVAVVMATVDQTVIPAEMAVSAVAAAHLVSKHVLILALSVLIH